MLDEARFDSSGAFTVDGSKLRRTYQGLLKAEPDLVLCKLFQAAVASRPSRLDLRVSRSAIALHWDGVLDLESLHQRLINGGAGGSERNLGPALRLAATRPDLALELHSGGRTLVWRDGRSSLEAQRRDGTCAILTSARWRPLAHLKWPEFARFRARLGYQPVQMTINGLTIPVGEPGTLATHARFSSQPSSGCVGLNLVDTPAVYSFDGDSTGRCVQYINLNANVGITHPYTMQTHFSNDVLVIVQDGLPVYRSNSWLGQVGVFMVVADNSLPNDASSLNLVEGPALRAALDRARKDTEHFLCELESRFPVCSNPQLAAAMRALRFLPR
ncbi:hypothetical protein JST97_25020 [bacterium]|nr:hypothetical protein [bacterium]